MATAAGVERTQPAFSPVTTGTGDISRSFPKASVVLVHTFLTWPQCSQEMLSYSCLRALHSWSLAVALWCHLSSSSPEQSPALCSHQDGANEETLVLRRAAAREGQQACIQNAGPVFHEPSSLLLILISRAVMDNLVLCP